MKWLLSLGNKLIYRLVRNSGFLVGGSKEGTMRKEGKEGRKEDCIGHLKKPLPFKKEIMSRKIGKRE